MMIYSSFVPLGIKLGRYKYVLIARNDIYSSLFSRKLRMLCVGRSSGLFRFWQPSRPNPVKPGETVVQERSKGYGTHSIGECSGFSRKLSGAPDSLL